MSLLNQHAAKKQKDENGGIAVVGKVESSGDEGLEAPSASSFSGRRTLNLSGTIQKVLYVELMKGDLASVANGLDWLSGHISLNLDRRVDRWRADCHQHHDEVDRQRSDSV